MTQENGMTQGDEIRTRDRQRMLAGVLLVGAGLFDVAAHIAEVDDDPYVVVTAKGVYDLNLTGWAWAHLVVGFLMALTGILLFSGRRWSIRFAASVALAGIVLHLILLPYEPLWSLMVIGLAVATLRLLWRCWAGTPNNEVASTGRPSR